MFFRCVSSPKLIQKNKIMIRIKHIVRKIVETKKKFASMIKNKLTIRVKSSNRNVVKMRKIATLSKIDKKTKKKNDTNRKICIDFCIDQKL